MAYTSNMAKSARRHLAAGDRLNEDPEHHRRRDLGVAGYLYGLAAECALKQLMREGGVERLPEAQKRDDPYFAHFPELKAMLRDRIEGRRATALLTIAKDAALMNGWDIRMRYAPNDDIEQDRVPQWRDQAAKLVNKMECP